MSDRSQLINPRLVFSPGYDIHFLGLENLHPFDSRKYGRAWNVLLKQFGESLATVTLTPTAPVDLALLQLVHSADYLERLNHRDCVAAALELGSLGLLPISVLNSRILEPMRLATMGTLMAAEAALQTGMAINLAGGYHHANRDRGEGFCLFADVALAIAYLRQAGQLALADDILIIDLDAHQGNGVARIFQQDATVHILDMYNREIYPHDPIAAQRIDCPIPLPSGTRDEAYLGQLKEDLPAFLRTIPQPKLAFYNAGTDIFEDDPLGRLRVSEKGVLERDRVVFHTLTAAEIPWVMVLSGGYTRQSYQLVAQSAAYVLQTWGNNFLKHG